MFFLLVKSRFSRFFCSFNSKKTSKDSKKLEVFWEIVVVHKSVNNLIPVEIWNSFDEASFFASEFVECKVSRFDWGIKLQNNIIEVPISSILLFYFSRKDGHEHRHSWALFSWRGHQHWGRYCHRIWSGINKPLCQCITHAELVRRKDHR